MKEGAFIMNITPISHPSFNPYGRIIHGYDLHSLMIEMQNTPLPEEVIYVPSDAKLEALDVSSDLKNGIFGQTEIQVGYCNGHNQKLNALEYHRNSEINLAVTDLVLLLGKQQDIADDFTYDTRLTEAFLVPAGTLIELYATTLHYAPCHLQDKGFRCTVILPKGTNTDLEGTVKERCGEEKLLFAKNKWLIGHAEGGLPENAWIGLKGENISL